MLLRHKDPKGFTVQTSRSEFKTVIKNEDGQLRAKEQDPKKDTQCLDFTV